MSTPTVHQRIQAAPLGHVQKRVWSADPGAYGGRKARRAGAYEVFISDQICERNFALAGDAVAAVTEASLALQHLEASTPRLARLGAPAQNLLRSESVGWSRPRSALTASAGLSADLDHAATTNRAARSAAT